MWHDRRSPRGAGGVPQRGTVPGPEPLIRLGGATSRGGKVRADRGSLRSRPRSCGSRPEPSRNGGGRPVPLHRVHTPIPHGTGCPVTRHIAGCRVGPQGTGDSNALMEGALASSANARPASASSASTPSADDSFAGDPLVRRSRRVWTSGAYEFIAEGFQEGARHFVSRHGLPPDERVLDVALRRGAAHPRRGPRRRPARRRPPWPGRSGFSPTDPHRNTTPGRHSRCRGPHPILDPLRV